MTESAGVGQPRARACLRVAGRTLARHQFDLALTLDCKKIVCIANSTPPELMALRDEAEHAGVIFHIVSGAHELPRLISAADDVIILTEGLLAHPPEVKRLVEHGHAVLVQPVEDGLGAGFERIDINNASAGIVRLPGRLVDRLNELPADYDAPSALTRIALQAGVPMRHVPEAARRGVRWQLVRSDSEACVIENEWLPQQLGAERGESPGRVLARAGVLAFGSSLLHAGHASKAGTIGTLGAMAIALGFGWLGLFTLAFVFCAIAWVLLQMTVMLHEVEGRVWTGALDPLLRTGALALLLDVELIVLCVWNFNPAIGASGALFAPIMLLLLVHLVPRLGEHSWTGWISDRALLSLLLACFAAFGVLTGGVRLLAVCLAITAIAFSAPKSVLPRR